MSFINLNNSRLDNRQLETFLAIIIMVLAIPAMIVVLSTPTTTNTSTSTSTGVSTEQTNTRSTAVYDPYISNDVGQVVTTGYTPVGAVNPNMQLTVLVGLQFSNPSALNSYLTNVQTPSSPAYHHYMTKQQFDNTFSPSQATYTKLVNYFTQTGLTVSTYPDRVSIKLVGTVSQFENVFNTQIQMVSMNSRTFYAPVKSMKLKTDASSITAVVGLNNYYKATPTSTISQSIQAYENYQAYLKANPSFSNNPGFCNNYLGQYDNNQGNPSCENQLLVGSDMQSAYQVNQIFAKKGYDFNETVATILWDGYNGFNLTNTQVGPFVPADLQNYFTNTLPSGEPQPIVSPLCANYDQSINQSYICGHPIDGAVAPSILAKNDTSQVNFESTLDLEMVGSIAPGANAVEVYGPSGYSNYLDDCLATILNAQTGPLSHTVAISNSYGIFDEPGAWGAIIDPLWQQYTQEAAALGISILASTGDSANYNGEIPSNPATVGYNNYGVISVGGTQTFVNGTPSLDGSGTTNIINQSVWFGTPYYGDGSQGGVSVSYTEPVWQQQSFDANNIIQASEPQISGRATPDISAIGNNMNITISYFLYNATGWAYRNHTALMLPIWGTSVASPLAAGVVADMAHYLNSSEGFFEGLIYQLGQAQADGLYGNSSSTILPFNDVADYSSNFVFIAYPGYDLATGWGSINAWNFVHEQSSVRTVTFTQTGLNHGSWAVMFDGAVLSSEGSSITFMAENGTHSYYIENNAGLFSNVKSGTVTMAGSSISVPVAFSSSDVSGQGVSNMGAENLASTPSSVNFTFSALGPVSDLPMSELFGVPQNELVDTISLYLNGTGQVAVSIGSNLWQSDALAPITINVNGTGWYNVTFPTIVLRGAIGNYYLNVWDGSQPNNYVNWGFINNATATPPTSLNDYGSYSQILNIPPYNYYINYGVDSLNPAVYMLGFDSNAPAIQGQTYGTTQLGQTTALAWKLASGSDVPGTQTYSITKNGTTVASGTWASGYSVYYTTTENTAGTFIYTINVKDSVGGTATASATITVPGPSSTTPSTNSTTTSTTSSTSSTPGFEVMTTVFAIMVGVTFYLRKRSKK